MQKGVIYGDSGSRNVYIDGVMLMADESLKVRNHSPTGFAWGYGGSGPSQLALAILLELSPESAEPLYQDFKWEFLVNVEKGKDFQLDIRDVQDWIKRKRGL